MLGGLRIVEALALTSVQALNHAEHAAGALDEVRRDMAAGPTGQRGGGGPVVVRVADRRAQQERGVFAHSTDDVAEAGAVHRHGTNVAKTYHCGRE